MHQMIIKDIATSTTFDCYFGQFFDGITSGATSSIEIMLVGATGSITGGFDGRTRSVPIHGFKWNHCTGRVYHQSKT